MRYPKGSYSVVGRHISQVSECWVLWLDANAFSGLSGCYVAFAIFVLVFSSEFDNLRVLHGDPVRISFTAILSLAVLKLVCLSWR